jgi:hypothetical protein
MAIKQNRLAQPTDSFEKPMVAEDAKALSTRSECALSLNSDRRGFEEEVDQSDLIIPRAKLVQPTSDEMHDPANTTLRGGMIINSLTKEELSKMFVPIFYYKEYLRFNPRKKSDRGFLPDFAPGALIWRTRDGNDPRVAAECQFGPVGETPVALTTLNFFSLFKDSAMPLILSFGKTSYKAGKNLLSLAKLRGGAMFSRQYKLSVLPMTNDQGSYFVMKVDPCGDCDAEMFKLGESYFNQFGMKRDTLKTHVEEGEVL